MPKKKGKKGKSKKGSKKKAAVAAEKEEVKGKTKIFLRVYQTNCLMTDSVPIPRILKSCRECLEEGKPLTKFFVDTSPDLPKDPAKSAVVKGRSAKATPVGGRAVSAAVTKTLPTADTLEKPATPSPDQHILLQPLFKSLAEATYDYMRCLYVWNINVDDDGAVAIALFLESPLSGNMKVLELRSTELTPWALVRLAKPLDKIGLTVLNLDYNHLSRDVLSKLCAKLQLNFLLETLSLNYCNLDHTCGDVLGAYIVTSQIRVLSLIGNGLQCNGCTDLIRPLVSLCESSSFNAIKLDTDEPTTAAAIKEPGPSTQPDTLAEKATGGPSAVVTTIGEPSSFAASLPPLARLDLRDNSIDPHGCNEGEQTFEPVIAMRAIKRWMISSPGIEELNLDHNLIGDGGARELLQGLIMRKEAGLPTMKVVVTVYISQETFQKIVELCSFSKKKKKGKKKKK